MLYVSKSCGVWKKINKRKVKIFKEGKKLKLEIS